LETALEKYLPAEDEIREMRHGLACSDKKGIVFAAAAGRTVITRYGGSLRGRYFHSGGRGGLSFHQGIFFSIRGYFTTGGMDTP